MDDLASRDIYYLGSLAVVALGYFWWRRRQRSNWQTFVDRSRSKVFRMRKDGDFRK